MKIKAINYILHCQCGKRMIQTIKSKITKLDGVCPFCKDKGILTVIGTIEYFGDHGEYSRVHYSLNPIKENGKWIYKKPEEIISFNKENNNNSLTWEAKEEQWKLDEQLSKIQLKEELGEIKC
jgi:hypothetical protein